MSDDVVERYQRAVASGDERDLEAFAATGRAGILLLRDVMTRRRDPEVTGNPDPRNQLDNLALAFAEIAKAEPHAFLDVFEDREFDETSFVLIGLGYVDDPRATSRLVRAAGSRNESARMHAAIGLGRQSTVDVTGTLMRLVMDEAFLVRHHALGALERVGDSGALPGLRAIARQGEGRVASAVRGLLGREEGAVPDGFERAIDRSPFERGPVRAAISAIDARSSGGNATG